MLQFPPSLTLDEKFDFLIALAQERNDAKRKAKGAKPECRDKPVVSRTGRVVKPATVACGSVCRQKQNCKITKKQLDQVRRQMPGASRREVAEAIKKAMAKKRQGMGTKGALYEGTKGARGARGNERIEARKRKGERKAGPKPFLKEMPEMSGDEWEEYGRMVDEGKWAYGNGEPVQVNREGGAMAVDKIKDYRLHRGQRYYQVVPKGARTKPEQHFWAREDQLSPLTSGAKGVKPTRSPGFKDSEVEISWKRGERQVVPSKRIGAIHLATGRLGNPTMVVGGNEVEFSTKKGAASVAKAFHGLIQDAPNLRKVLDEGGSVDLNSASEAQYLFNRALVASEKDLGEKDLGRVEMARKQIGWYEEQQSQGSESEAGWQSRLKALETIGVQAEQRKQERESAANIGTIEPATPTPSKRQFTPEELEDLGLPKDYYSRIEKVEGVASAIDPIVRESVESHSSLIKDGWKSPYAKPRRSGLSEEEFAAQVKRNKGDLTQDPLNLVNTHGPFKTMKEAMSHVVAMTDTAWNPQDPSSYQIQKVGNGFQAYIKSGRIPEALVEVIRDGNLFDELQAEIDSIAKDKKGHRSQSYKEAGDADKADRLQSERVRFLTHILRAAKQAPTPRQDSRLPYLGFGLNPNPFYHPLWDLMGY